MHRGMRFVLAVLAAGAVGAQAQAQPQTQRQSSAPPNALQGFSQNRNQPVRIDSASLDVRDRDKIATFTGNVKLVQGDTVLRCKVLVVHYDGDQSGGPKSSAPGVSGNSQISHMEALGSVVVTQKDQTATGEKAIYDMKADTVTLYAANGGSVAVTQGPNIVESDKSLVVHLASGVSHFTGQVRALIMPKSENRSTSDTKAAPRAAPAKSQTQSSNPQGLY